MKSTWMILITLVFAGLQLVIPTYLFAQSSSADSSLDCSDNDYIMSEDWDDDITPSNFKVTFEKPTLELSYSSITMTHKEITSSAINSIGMFEGRIGSTKNLLRHSTLPLIKERSNFIFIGGGATSFALSKNDGLESTLWRFGIGDRTAQGWKFGNMGILMTHGTSAVWTNMTVDDTLKLVTEPKLRDFHDAVRFGKIAEAGVNFVLGGGVSITASYEQSSVFPRHLFFYWAGSEIIEGIAQGAVGAFIRKVEKSSPKSAPIVAFLLRNGISFGAGFLRKESMNWPFETAPALTTNGVRVGANIQF